MNNITNKNPFLKLLEPENLSKIKINDELIPAFRIVVSKINDYFLENNLMDVKDWDSIFDRYLLSENSDQIEIELNERIKRGQGEYNGRDKKIKIVWHKDIKASYHALCHEFIHFLSEIDSFPRYPLSGGMVLREGMTELLTRNIMGQSPQSHFEAYSKEVEMAKFYCEMSDGSHYESFLNNKYYFDLTHQAALDMELKSDHYSYTELDNDLIQIQRIITELSLNNNHQNITSFDDFINIISKLNNRPYNDENYMERIFEKYITSYLSDLSLTEEAKHNLENKLLELCKIARKAHAYGDIEVAEFHIDDFYIAYDKDYRIHKDDRIRQFRRDTYPPSQYKRECITYKNEYEEEIKTEIILDDTINYTNWNYVYNETLSQIKKIVEPTPENDMIFDEEYERERQRIMKARFSEQDKQRLLKELEEEYRDNNFENNSGRSIR